MRDTHIRTFSDVRQHISAAVASTKAKARLFVMLLCHALSTSSSCSKFHPGRSAAGVTPRITPGADSPADGSPRATGFRSPRYDTYVVGRGASRCCGCCDAGRHSSGCGGTECNHSGQGDDGAGPDGRRRKCFHHRARAFCRHERCRQLQHGRAGRTRAWSDCCASYEVDRAEARREVDRASARGDHPERRDGRGRESPQPGRRHRCDRRDGTDQGAVRCFPRG